MSLSGLFRITRPVNAVVAGFASVIGYLIATGTVVPVAAFLVVIVTLVTAAGNVINDYFDAEIDAVNRADRPIPSGTVSRGAARSYATVLFLAGILVSLFTTPLCIAIAVFNSFLLVAYAARLKGLPFAGNIAVSYLSASMFLFGGALAGWESLVHVIPIAVITFFAMLARELVKAAEDVEGDRSGGADTLPLRIGVLSTVRIAFAFALLAVIASAVPYLWWGAWYLAGIGIVDAVILFAGVRALPCRQPDCVKRSNVSTLLKAGFFSSLVVFTLSAVLL
ncbi:MAG TPA: geranylgeranylglycerol-phosphate geranylgeranyltransferase [Methanoregula sp.]|nr:geranylgeranylglycerol-phosphate geranylgeranyltransferase [Methanoregula sp.]